MFKNQSVIFFYFQVSCPSSCLADLRADGSLSLCTLLATSKNKGFIIRPKPLADACICK